MDISWGYETSEKLRFTELLPLGGIYDGGISYVSQTDGSPYVLLLCANGLLMRYNIKKDKLKKLSKKPRQLLSSTAIRDHFTLDIDNGIIYFVDDFFAIYNLNTNKWDIKCQSFQNIQQAESINFDCIGTNKSVQFIPNPINELHVIFNGVHIKYDDDKNKFIELNKSNPPKGNVRHMIYMPKMKLLVLLLWNLGVWTCTVSKGNQEEFEWKEVKELIIPPTYAETRNYTCQPMVAFDNLLVLFISNEQIGVDIWFFDMITKKRYKSDKQYALRKTLTTCVKDDEDVLHCIGSGFYHRINLTEILPTYQRNKLLVYGYTRLQEIEYDLYQHVPASLSQLILNFYPSNL